MYSLESVKMCENCGISLQIKYNKVNIYIYIFFISGKYNKIICIYMMFKMYTIGLYMRMELILVHKYKINVVTTVALFVKPAFLYFL